MKKTSPKKSLRAAIRAAGGMAALASMLDAVALDRFSETGLRIGDRRTVDAWLNRRVPAEWCLIIEAATGVRCEELRPDVAWSVLSRSERRNGG